MLHTKLTAELRFHARQLSFPCERGARVTALRQTDEPLIREQQQSSLVRCDVVLHELESLDGETASQLLI